MKLVLYSKPGCHLCEGLQEKLEALAHLDFTLEIRDITTQPEWFAAYQYQIPVLCRAITIADGSVEETILPRLSPRAPIARVEQMLQKYWAPDTAK
ncbi:MAG: glutaredoxin family protein [Leptolyngbyaceae cyanobacterium]